MVRRIGVANQEFHQETLSIASLLASGRVAGTYACGLGHRSRRRESGVDAPGIHIDHQILDLFKIIAGGVLDLKAT